MRNRANKKRKQPREEILQVAKTLFAKHGFYETDRTDIRVKAHVSEATISTCFKDNEKILDPKEMILVEILERGWRNVNQLIKSLEETNDIIAMLREILSIILDTFEKDRELKVIFVAHSRELYELGKKLMGSEVRKLVLTIESIFNEGRDKGIFRKDLSPKSMQRAFFGTIEEFLHSWTLKDTAQYRTEASREQLEKTIDSMLFAFLDIKPERLEEPCLT